MVLPEPLIGVLMKLRRITLKNFLVITACSVAAVLVAALLGFEPAYVPPQQKTEKEMIREAGAALDAACQLNEDKC